MQVDKLSENWLFEKHSKETIKEWLRQLRYFYFQRAWGGQANDGDAFQVAFIFFDRNDLVNKIKLLGLNLNIIPDNFPRPIIGQSYTAAEFEKFKHVVKRFPDLEQPGYSTIFGHKVFIWIYENSIKISIAGTKDNNRYNVDKEDFNVCLELEKYFDNFGWLNIIDKSVERSACCISQSKYPELFGERIENDFVQ